MLIKDMTDDHLRNAIKMLERIANARWYSRLSMGYAALSQVNGEQASYCLESEVAKMEEEGPDPWAIKAYGDLIAERDKREIRLSAQLAGIERE